MLYLSQGFFDSSTTTTKKSKGSAALVVDDTAMDAAGDGWGSDEDEDVKQEESVGDEGDKICLFLSDFRQLKFSIVDLMFKTDDIILLCIFNLFEPWC